MSGDVGESISPLLTVYGETVHPRIMRALDSPADCVAALREAMFIAIDFARSNDDAADVLAAVMRDSAARNGAAAPIGPAQIVEGKLREERQAMLNVVQLAQERNQITQNMRAADLVMHCQAFVAMASSLGNDSRQQASRAIEDTLVSTFAGAPCGSGDNRVRCAG